MSVADHFGPTSPRISGVTSPTGPVAAAARGGPPLVAATRGAAFSTFAAHLELLAKEERSPSRGKTAGISTERAGTLAPSDDGAPVDPFEASTRPAGDPELESDDRHDGARSGSDDATVGWDATLDPMLQVIGALAPRTPTPVATPNAERATAPDVRSPMEQLMAKLVRRVAWSGNGRAGVARLELGAGELEGATLTIHADDGRVHVALDVPPGVDGAAWKARIGERLARRGIQVDAVEVG